MNQTTSTGETNIIDMEIPQNNPTRKTGVEFEEAALVASIVKEDFYEFVVEFWDTIIQETPVFNWHVRYICGELQELAERVFNGEAKEYDLIINIAPGSTKSTIVSQMFPAWCWTRFPQSRFVCASYAKEVALKDSIKTRDIVQSEKYKTAFPDIQIRDDENMKGLFTNTQMGFRYSAGVGGAVTGFHAHFLIVDDPLNPEEAFSDADLKKANRWMTNTLPSRKVDKKVSVTILIQQRLHQADPTGDWIERSKGKGIKHISLPAKINPDADEKEKGEWGVQPRELEDYYTDGLFDPIRMPQAVLDQALKDMGAYGFAGQMLQNPVPLGGGTFETEKLVLRDAAPVKMLRYIRSWDKAGTQDGGAWSVGLLMAIDKKGQYWILDVIRDQLNATNREMMIKQTADLDGGKVEIELEIEGGSGGKESGENTIKMLSGYIVHATHPTGDKESRAYPLASQMGAGNVFCLKKPWTKDFIEELRFFPNSRYKDQVDAASGAFNRLARKKKRIGGW
jgi:predicted phage terminase large subunit-like protein